MMSAPPGSMVAQAAPGPGAAAVPGAPSSGLTLQEKRKLLWGKKSAPPAAGAAAAAPGPAAAEQAAGAGAPQQAAQPGVPEAVYGRYLPLPPSC